MDRPSRDYSTSSVASGERDEAPTTSSAKREASPSRRGTRAWHASLTEAAKRLATNPDEQAKIEAQSF